ncbi:unnamed protein product [Blepharisma stoltei]|uniref:SAP domain-containing protein n=1 Tax=Blepharisma stoltei TaxID=1481888 RepID=A0AAU9ISN6_9CILI|nr:unnamed protein product [Blepharisma stoltei]
MIRRFFSIEKWSAMSMLQLRDELTRRSLPRTGTRNEILKKLELDDSKKAKEIEVMRQEIKYAHELKEEESNHFLAGLSKEFLIGEILKRRPKQEIQAKYTKKQLLDILSDALEDEHVDTSNLANLVILHQKVTENPLNVTVNEICQALEKISTIFQIPQSDVNFLRFSEKQSLEGIWNILFTNLRSMNGEQLYILTKSLYILLGYFDKSFKQNSEKIDTESLADLIKQVKLRSNDLKAYELGNAIDIFSKLSKDPEIEDLLNELRMIVPGKIQNVEKYSHSELLAILDSFQKNCYAEHKEIVDKIISALFHNDVKVAFERSLQTLSSIHRIGAPIPLSLLLELDTIPKNYLYNIDAAQYFNFGKILAQQEKLSENFGKSLIESFSLAKNLTDQYGISLYADFVYFLHDKKIFSQLVSRINLFKMCLETKENIDLISALRLTVAYLPHLVDEALLYKLLEEMSKYNKNDSVWADNQIYLSQILDIIVKLSKEKPIFNYQIQSIVQVQSRLKIQLARNIVDILEVVSPYCGALYRYYSSNLCKEIPSAEILLRPQTTESIQPYARILWKYRNKLTNLQKIEVVEKGLIILQENLKAHEAAYYFSCVFPELAPDSTDLYISIQNIKIIIGKFIKEQGPFTLGIAYNLSHTPTFDALNEMIYNVDVQSLWGEILIKTLIMLSKAERNDLFSLGTPNLSYIDESEPKFPISLMKEFLNVLCRSSSLPVDLIAISKCFSYYMDDLSDKELLMLGSLLRSKWSQIDKPLKKKLEAIELKVGSELTRLIDFSESNEVRKALATKYENIYPSIKNVHILEGLAQHRLFIPSVYNKYISLLPRVKEERDLLSIISQMLSSLSVIGFSTNVVNSVNSIIDRYRLWQYISFDSLVNYLFVHSRNPEIFSTVPSAIKERFIDRFNTRNRTDEIFLNPKSQLMCYRPFLYSTVLEPRFIISNDASKSSKELSYSEKPQMPFHEVLFNCKIHAILNILNLEHTETCLQAVDTFYLDRKNSDDIYDFKMKFVQILGQIWKIRNFTMEESEKDAVTKWKPDLLFNSAKVGIIYNQEGDMVYNENGEEVGTVFMSKVIKDQLEKLGGIKVVQINSKTWKEMDGGRKYYYVENLVQRFNIR